MKWIKETKGKRQAAIGAVFLVVFLSLVMALSCAEFYKRYKEQVIHTEESQLLTIAGIIGNNLDMFLNEQLEQIDLFYSSENGLLGEKMQMNRKISYFLDKNEKLYNWIRLICPDGRQILYKAGTEPFYEAAEAEHTPAGHATNAQITGKKISEETGWYEMYIEKQVEANGAVYDLVLSMDLEQLYRQIVEPVKIGKGGYSIVKDQDTYIIMHHVKSQIGLEALEDRQKMYTQLDLDDLKQWLERQNKEDKGTGLIHTYIWDNPELKAVKRVAAFQAIYIQGERWIVNSTIPLTELSQPLDTMMEILVGIAVLYMVLLITATVYILYNRFRTISQYREIAYLKEINQGMEMVAKKNDEIRHYQRIQSLGMMASHIAHEFNNYLTPVLIYSELLENDDTISEENRQMIHEITDSVDKASDLSKKLLAFSRQDTGIRLERLDFAQEVRKAMSVVRQLVPAAITLKTKIPDTPQYALVRQGMAEHILMNLCKNAFQAMEQSDKKELTVELAEMGTDQLCLRISDTGCGIPEDVQKKIFEPFYTTKGSRQGTGLGLSVVRNIIASVGGKIEVESRQGEGTTFLLMIPKSSSEEEGNLRKRLKSVSRIAIISEDARMSAYKGKKFEKTGQIEVYTHPAALLDRVQKTPSFYGLIIADEVLPMMNGIELCEMIRRMNPEIRLLLLSEQDGSDVQWYLNNGMIDRFMLKQDFFSEFEEAIKAK